MPRRQPLGQITPNKFYQIDATLKYQHVGPNNITAIIEQGTVQSKISIPKDGIELEEGKQYVFGKCFYSKNGWLYAKKPSETVLLKEQPSSREKLFTLKEIYEERDKLSDHCIEAQFRVIYIEPKETIVKNGQNLFIYKMMCFSDSMLINVQLWNQEIKVEDFKYKIVKFIGFKVKLTSHQTINLVSTVYSKLEKLSRLPFNRQIFNYDPNKLYRNVSSLYEVRKLDQIDLACQSIHKNYSICEAAINFLQELTYEGCNRCKKKLFENECYKCGSNVTKNVYVYLKIVLEDDTGMLESAVFDDHVQAIAKNIEQGKKAIFKINSSVKKNHLTGQSFVSHVVTQINDSAGIYQ